MSEFRGTERKPGVRETRFERELRQLSLTQRLLGYNARTQTICALAGLTPHKVSVLRRGCEQSATARHRGPSPNSFSLLLRSPRARAESACLAVLLDRFGALPKRYGGGTSRWSLHSAERLCDVFDFYGRLVPRSAISFEQLVLLSKGLCDPTCLRSEACQQCGATIVVDPVARPRLRCDACISYGIDAPRVPAAPADGQRPVIQPAPTAETI